MRGLRYWLPSYLISRLRSRQSINRDMPVHIMFCVVDHFEPFNNGVDTKQANARVQIWVDKYPQMAAKFIDSDGVHPKHTWFYPPHHDIRFLDDLVGLCKRGYGEIEMHLHHNRMDPFPDTAESLKKKIEDCIKAYSRYGIFCLPDDQKKFGFIHGDWSLDNARGVKFCGINNEISILKDCGCYADFTFPSLGEAQPLLMNRFFYAKDDPRRPKSYDYGAEVAVNKESLGDLLMICGVVGVHMLKKNHFWRPKIEASNIDNTDRLFPERIDYLVKNAITIKGMTNWLFIKLHTHGARNADYGEPFGFPIDNVHEYLLSHYNDKRTYFLHYVSAREMYNIVKAAEAGKSGNPNEYRNFEIPKYLYLQ